MRNRVRHRIDRFPFMVFLSNAPPPDELPYTSRLAWGVASALSASRAAQTIFLTYYNRR